jgi:hypothetical protein
VSGAAGESAAQLSAEEEGQARSTLRYVGYAVLSVAVLGSIAGVLVDQVGKLPHIHWRFAPGWLALSVLGFACLQLTHAALWRQIVVALHGHIGPARSRAIWSVSQLAKYVPTSMLMPVTRMTMAARAGVPRTVTAASMVYELPLVMTASVIVSAYYVLRIPQVEHHAWRWALLAIPVVALVVLDPRVFRPLGDMALRRLGRGTLPQTLSRRRVLAIAALYVGTLVLAGAATYAFARALHPVGASGLPPIFASFGVALFLSYAGFLLPAGLGAREAGFTAALSLALPTAVALAVAIGVRLVQMALEVLYGVLTPVVARRVEAQPSRKAA